VAAFNWNPARHQLESVAALRWNTHSLSAFCFLTSFSTARVHLVFTPMNNSRRSMRLQAEHKNVWCSNPGSVVGSAGTASIKSISALHTKHRIAVSPSPNGRMVPKVREMIKRDP
jgi:hypothetical protein